MYSNIEPDLELTAKKALINHTKSIIKDEMKSS